MNLSFSFIILLLSFIITKSENTFIKITKQSDLNPLKIIGPYGTFALKTDTKSSIILTNTSKEDLFKFKANFRNSENILYIFDCSLWIPKTMNVIVKCQVNETFLTSSTNQFTLEKGIIIMGDNYIEITSADNYFFDIDMKEFNIPFIYSEPQIINLDKEEDSYELNFYADSYKNEKLVLFEKVAKFSFFYLDNQTINNNILKCEIKRQIIEEMMTNKMTLGLAFLSEELGLFNFEFVSDVIVQYNKPKKNLEVYVREIYYDFHETGSLTAFKTNITDIETLITDRFDIEVQTNKGKDYINCFFKKDNNKIEPLLLLCEIEEFDYFFQLEHQINLDEINYKYNFTISIKYNLSSKINISDNYIGNNNKKFNRDYLENAQTKEKKYLNDL